MSGLESCGFACRVRWNVWTEGKPQRKWFGFKISGGVDGALDYLVAYACGFTRSIIAITSTDASARISPFLLLLSVVFQVKTEYDTNTRNIWKAFLLQQIKGLVLQVSLGSRARGATLKVGGGGGGGRVTSDSKWGEGVKPPPPPPPRALGSYLHLSEVVCVTFDERIDKEIRSERFATKKAEDLRTKIITFHWLRYS